jgi:hypothetical protein
MCAADCIYERPKQAFMNTAMNIPFREKHKMCSSAEQLVTNTQKPRGYFEFIKMPNELIEAEAFLISTTVITTARHWNCATTDQLKEAFLISISRQLDTGTVLRQTNWNRGFPDIDITTARHCNCATTDELKQRLSWYRSHDSSTLQLCMTDELKQKISWYRYHDSSTLELCYDRRILCTSHTVVP